MTISSKFKELEDNKRNYITRAENISKLTIPKIFPVESKKDGKLDEPEQSLGSIGVSTLASKLMLILFPPSGSTKYSIDELSIKKRNDILEFTKNVFNTLEIDEETKIENIKKIDKEKNTSSGLKTALRLLEKKQDALLNNSDIINKISYGMLHFIITGNFAFFIDKDMTSRLYSLRDYVVDRDRNGELIEVIARDYVSFYSLNEEQQKKILNESGKKEEELKEISLYLQSKKKSKNKWEIKEFADDVEMRSWELENNPIIVPFSDKESGNIYNYGIANEIYGDLNAYEQLSKNTKQVSAAASKILFLVKKGSTNVVRDLVNAKNLDFVYGDAEKIRTLQIDKINDLNIVNNEKQELKTRISMFFMLNSAAQRDGERVTKFEIQKIIQDIDASFGNLYSILSREIQYPLAKIMLEYLKKNDELKNLIPDDLEINIVSVKQALANEINLNNLMFLIDSAGKMGDVRKINNTSVLQEICKISDMNFNDLVLDDSEYALKLKNDANIQFEIEKMKMEFQIKMQQIMQQNQNQNNDLQQ